MVGELVKIDAVFLGASEGLQKKHKIRPVLTGLKVGPGSFDQRRPADQCGSHRKAADGDRTGLMAGSAGASGHGRLFSNDSGSMRIDEL